MLSKKERLQLICDMIAAHPINTQAEIVERLEAAGVSSTQATVSRDMKNLGIIKVPVEGGSYIYGLPKNRLGIRQTADFKYIYETKRRGDHLHLDVEPGTTMVLKKQIKDRYGDRIFSLLSDDDSLLLIAQSPEDAQDLEGILKEW